MAQGYDEPAPFLLRRGLPYLCRTSADRWAIANIASMVYATAGIGLLAAQRGGSMVESATAAALFAGLPWVRFCARRPVLVDMPALACSVLAAVVWPVNPFASFAIALFGSLVGERVPIWSALFAWDPILLAALVMPVGLYFLSPKVEPRASDPLADTLRHPLRTGLKWHRGKWLSPESMLLPWGMCVVAILNPSIWLFAALAMGYSQLLLATDTVRLYQQAAPVVCVSAALAIPTSGAFVIAPLLVAAHVFNPWKGDGV